MNSRLTYSPRSAFGAGSFEKNKPQDVIAARPNRKGLHARSFPREPTSLLASDCTRNNCKSSSIGRVLASNGNMVSEQRRNSNQGCSLLSQRLSPPGLRRLIPMARPRVSRESMLNELKYEKERKLKQAKLIYRMKLAKAVQRTALSGVRRHAIK